MRLPFDHLHIHVHLLPCDGVASLRCFLYLQACVVIKGYACTCVREQAWHVYPPSFASFVGMRPLSSKAMPAHV